MDKLKLPSSATRTPPTLDVWEEMKSYVGLDEQDLARLHTLLPFVEPRLTAIVDHFYATIERFPNAASVLENPAQTERLKQSLIRFIREMLTGPFDEGYYQRRRRIGEVHVRVGLPERYVFTSMSIIRQDICDVAVASLPEAEIWPTCHSISRITDLELAVMSSTYLEAHEESRLRSLQDLIIENMPVTVLCLDAKGRVTSATRPSARLFGGEIDRGAHFQAFLPDALTEVADLQTHVGRALATGHEITIPRVVVGTGATERHFRFTLVPLEHARARLLLHVEELTDVVQAEQRLQHAEALARIGSLAAHLAHEIRNPLAAISATLQVIVGTLPVEDRRRNILSKVQVQVHRLDRLVTDLLSYARPARVQLAPVDLATVVQDAARESGVPAEIIRTEPTTGMADTQYLKQVLLNLLQNARDALTEHDLPVEGAVSVIVGPGPRIEVADTGPGIPAEVQGQLFEPFVTSKTRGTGLGLAISRKLVRAMGGELHLVSNPGEGARFELVLPTADGVKATPTIQAIIR